MGGKKVFGYIFLFDQPGYSLNTDVEEDKAGTGVSNKELNKVSACQSKSQQTTCKSSISL